MAMETQTIRTTSCRPINATAKTVKFISINELSKSNWEYRCSVPKCYSTRLCSYSKVNVNLILYITKDKIVLKSMMNFLTYRNSKRDTYSGIS